MFKVRKIKKNFKLSLTLFLALAIAVLTFASGLSSAGEISTASASVSSSSSGNTLSLMEMSNDFSTLVVRATYNKTLIFVEKMYFTYSNPNGKKLAVSDKNNPDDYVVINLTNSAGEWAKVWGYVREERMAVPNDPLERVETITYLEINMYWEWRRFTNDESWTVTVDDGFVDAPLSFTFDSRDRKDGVIFHIDGVYALPERYYPQVVYDWEFQEENPELLSARDNVLSQAIEALDTTPEGEPLRLKPVPMQGNANSNSNMSSNANIADFRKVSLSSNPDIPLEVSQTAVGIFTVVIVGIAIAVVAIGAVVAYNELKPAPVLPELAPPPLVSEPPKGFDPMNPDDRHPDQPPSPSRGQRKKAEDSAKDANITPDQRRELEKRNEFSPENDTPTGSKIVKLMLETPSGLKTDVFDENGNEIYLNRATNAVGNANFALISRKNNLLLRYDARDKSIRDTLGDRFAVNVDNKLVSMDGVQPFSLKSYEDAVVKLQDMNVNTSSVDISRYLYRMDDELALSRAMMFKTLNTRVGFFATIGNAFRNLFSSRTENVRNSGMQTFLDFLTVAGVALSGILLILFTLWVIRRVKTVGKA
ncbi:MAG: hypothetical protein FWD49_07185 [Firmicutes bacterium]|nr:hypothetical protein [Bacillota bacterium]